MLKPQTKTTEVLTKAFARDEASDYILEEDFEWRLWVRDVAPLKTSQRAEWDACMGVLYALVGRFAEAEECFGNSLRLSYSPDVVHNWLMCLLAGGNYVRAQELFATHSHPTKGAFSATWRAGVESFALEKFLEYKQIANQMGVEIPEDLPTEEVLQLVRANGLSDADVARHLEAAGSICVRHRIKPSLKRAFTGANGTGTLLSVLFVVPKTADEVFEMNIELAQAEEERGISKQLAFDVAFVQALPSDIEVRR